MKNKKLEKNKRILAIILMLILLAFMIIGGWLIGKPMLKFVSDPDSFRVWVSALGWKARLAFVGMVALQVVFAIIPGEPLEIVAGYAFGAIEGTVLCLAGFFVGSFAVFLFVRKWGIKFVRLFFTQEKIDKSAFLSDNKKLTTIAYILFLIPGTPKDIMVYLVALTHISPLSFFVIATIARLPSLVTSTIGGDLLGIKNYIFAAIVFVLTVLISAGGYLLYNYISKQHSKKS